MRTWCHQARIIHWVSAYSSESILGRFYGLHPSPARESQGLGGCENTVPSISLCNPSQSRPRTCQSPAAISHRMSSDRQNLISIILSRTRCENIPLIVRSPPGAHSIFSRPPEATLSTPTPNSAMLHRVPHPRHRNRPRLAYDISLFPALVRMVTAHQSASGRHILGSSIFPPPLAAFAGDYPRTALNVSQSCDR